MRSLQLLTAPLLTLGLAFAAPAARAEDTAPPEITHTPLDKYEKGKPIKVQAKITDESKFFPQIFSRWDGAAFGKGVDMKKATGKKAKDQYVGTVPGKGEVLEYYIEAYDEFGNGPARSGSPETPYKVEAAAPAVAEAPKEEPKAEPPKTEEPAATAQAEPPKTEEPAAETPKAEEPIAKKDAPKEKETPKPRKAPRAATETTTASVGSSGGRTITWIVGGTGVGLLAGGLLTGLAVKKADDAFTARLADKTNDPVSLQKQYDANKSLGTTATIMTVGGLVLVAGGTALYFLEPGLFGGGSRRADNEATKDDGKMKFAAAPINGGAAAVVAGKF